MPRTLRRTGRPTMTSPMTTSATERRDSGCQVGSARPRNRPSTSPDSAARSSRIRPSRVRRRSTAARRTGSGLADGWVLARLLDLEVDLDRLAVALVALVRRVALGHQPLGLAGLLEQAAPLGEGGLGLGPAVAGAGQRVAVALELGEGQLALVERRVRLLDRLLGELEPAGVAIAPRVQLVERLVELLAGPAGAPVGAADRRLQPVAQGALVARQVAQLEVVDRGGRAEEALGRDAGQLGHHLVGERRVGDRLALVVEPDGALARRRTSSRACPTCGPSSSSCSNSMVMIERASGGAPHGRSASSSAAVLVARLVRASSSARWIVVLPASLGPRMIVSPGASSMSKVR